MLGEVVSEEQEKDRTEDGSLHDPISDTFRACDSPDYSATVRQSSREPVNLNTVPVELVQKATMLSAVECQLIHHRCHTTDVDMATSVHKPGHGHMQYIS